MRVVTIDGPAGAGKSTVSRRLAERLGWRLLDTGAMYRAVTLAALRAGLDLRDHDALGALVLGLEIHVEPGLVTLNGEDVADLIRTPEVTEATKLVASSPPVRARLVTLQRACAETHDLVTEGRDQGTVVFPDALGKFYLTASDEERARRRHADHVRRGDALTLDDVLRAQRDRDATDAARALAPMEPAPDAEVVDTSGLGFDEVVNLLETAIRRRIDAAEARP